MAASANDVRAGGSWYELYAKDGITGVLDRVQKRIAAFAGSVQRVGSVAAVAGAGLLAPITALFKLSESRGAELAKMSLRLGLPIEALNKLQYAADRTGASLEEVMQDTTGRFSSLISQAPPIDTAAAKAAAETQKQLADASLALQQAVAPLATIVARYARQIAEFAKNNADLVPKVAAVGAGLLALGVALKLGAAAFALIIPVATAAWTAITGPVGLGILIGGGLAAAFMTLTEQGRAVADFLKGPFVGAVSAARDTWAGLADALGKGDLMLAGQIAIAGLTVAWRGFVLTATEVWEAFKVTFLEIWDKAIAGWQMIFNDLGSWVTTTFFGIAAALANAFAAVARTVLDTAGQVAKALDAIDPTDSLKGAIDTVERLKAAVADSRDFSAMQREVEERRKKEEERLIAKVAARAKAREEAGGEAVLDAQRRLDEARAELAALRAEAAKPADDRTAFDKDTSLNQRLLGAISVKGGFSATALNQQFGVSDNAQKQTELLKLISTGEGGLADNIARKLAPIVGAPKIVGGA